MVAWLSLAHRHLPSAVGPTRAWSGSVPVHVNSLIAFIISSTLHGVAAWVVCSNRRCFNVSLTRLDAVTTPLDTIEESSNPLEVLIFTYHLFLDLVFSLHHFDEERVPMPIVLHLL